jgi:hypothetical protein
MERDPMKLRRVIKELVCGAVRDDYAQRIRQARRLRDKARAAGDTSSANFHQFRARVDLMHGQTY